MVNVVEESRDESEPVGRLVIVLVLGGGEVVCSVLLLVILDGEEHPAESRKDARKERIDCDSFAPQYLLATLLQPPLPPPPPRRILLKRVILVTPRACFRTVCDAAPKTKSTRTYSGVRPTNAGVNYESEHPSSVCWAGYSCQSIQCLSRNCILPVCARAWVVVRVLERS